MGEPWNDTPTHRCGDGSAGPIVPDFADQYMCVACGSQVELSTDDEVRADRAAEAWEQEEDRRADEEEAQREHDRKVPLLAAAIARRRRGTCSQCRQRPADGEDGLCRDCFCDGRVREHPQ